MNWGGFAGGFSQGFNNGVSMAKTMRDIIKDRKLQDLREQGMAEAERQRAQSVQDMVKENGVEAAQPAASSTAAPTEAATTPVSPPTPVEARPLAPLPETATPAATAPETPDQSGTTSTPATEIPQPVAPSPVQATPAQVSQAQPAATPQAVAASGVTVKPSGKFSVNGQTYETREQAVAAAEKAAPSKMDLFMKNSVPKLAEQYVINGEPEKAKAWTDYAESANGKRVMKDWAAAYTAPDFDTAATRFGKFYSEHINDGVDYTGHKMLTKQDGTQVAVVTLKDKATGKTMEMEMTREKMLALGASNNPQKLFEQEQAKQASAEKMKYEAAIKAQERAAKRQDDVYMEGVKSKSQRQLEEFKQDRLDKREGLKTKGEMDKLGLKYELDAEFEQKYKKATSPTERRALLVDMLGKNDPRFMRDTPEEKERKIKEIEALIYKDDAKPAAQPGIAAKPMAYDAKYPVKYQKGTGKPFHLVDGQYVPIEGTIPPQAGGLPKK